MPVTFAVVEFEVVIYDALKYDVTEPKSIVVSPTVGIIFTDVLIRLPIRSRSTSVKAG